MTPDPPPRWAWPAALAGLFLAAAGAVALSGPGRIDIADAQTRYEVGRSLAEAGTIAVLNPDWTYIVLTGRDGRRFAPARLPQSVMAAAAILLADATGPATEARRQFFFTFHGAVVAGGLAVVYACWFRRRGLGPAAAVGWAAAGVFCTPAWYYATSGFDDILGTTAVVAVLVAADRAAAGGVGWAVLAGLLLGVAYHCKQPLAVFGLPAVAFADAPGPVGRRLVRAGVIAAGLAVGVAGFRYYEWYMFPPEAPAAPVEGFWSPDVPLHLVNPAFALADFAAGPASGVVWYAPAVLLGLAGVWRAATKRRAALIGAAVVFVGFLSVLSMSKGDPTWGPRYLTPLFGAAWLFAPDGARLAGRGRAAFLLAAGLVVQVLALAVDPLQMCFDRGVPGSYTETDPRLRFDLRLSHLANRPRAIYEAVTKPPAPEYSPAAVPTAVPDIAVELTPEALRAFMDRYEIYHGPRVWWASLSRCRRTAGRPTWRGRCCCSGRPPRPGSGWSGRGWSGGRLAPRVGTVTRGASDPP
jgi:hypothetical protein